MKKVLFILAVCVMALSAQAQVGEIKKSRGDSKVAEISKFITLDETQKSIIRNAYELYKIYSDSALYKVDDASVAAQLKYDAGRVFHDTLMGILTDSQRVKYVNAAYAPEIKAKTEYRMELLREKGCYSEKELEKMEKEIYDYLMLEKVVYVRDKYDFSKQKNNISRLKMVQPKTLKESQNIEKQKGLGKLRAGSITW